MAVTMLVLSLSPAQLYDGLEADRVLLKDGALVLDPQVTKGQVTTDVIDLGGDAVLGVPVAVTKAGVLVEGELQAPAAVAVSLRSGTTFFQAPSTWSDWVAVDKQEVPLKGRYVQVRLVLTTTDKAVLPKVTGLKIAHDAEPEAALKTGVTVKSSAIEKIVNSTVPFEYERQDQADLAWVRRTFKLDEVIAGKKTELEQLAALNTWVASRKNNREGNWHPKTRHYPWDIRVILRDEDGGTIYGHCGSYCVTLVTAAGAFGWQGRHIANSGYRRRSHEVPEIWVNELRKWVYFDPSLDAMYFDATTGEPLHSLQMHRIFLKYMYPNGAVQGTLDEDQQKKNNAAIDWSTFPATYKSALWAYGEKTQEQTFWHWGQGLMTCGRLQMTPRNNFHSKPQPYFTQFGNGPGSARDFPYWTDDQTPPTARLTSVHRRERDWYWTLNQASLRLVRTGEDVVTVELGTSQPHFKRFVAAVDGGKPETVASPMTWNLKPGRNTLVVNCEDEFGVAGLPSTVVLEYTKG